MHDISGFGRRLDTEIAGILRSGGPLSRSFWKMRKLINKGIVRACSPNLKLFSAHVGSANHTDPASQAAIAGCCTHRPMARAPGLLVAAKFFASIHA